MTAPFEPNHRQDDDLANQAEFDTETRDLYRALDHAGSAWRSRTSGDIRRVDERLRATISQMRATDAEANHAPPLVTNTPGAPSTTIQKIEQRGNRTMIETERPRARLNGWRLWVSAGATAALVIAFLATFAIVAINRNQNGIGAHGKKTVSTTTPTWVSLPNLNSDAVFSANGLPAIAPSDPNVVYETFAQKGESGQAATMRVTTDGGKTWKSLSTPIAATHIGEMMVGVSPFDAKVVFLSVMDDDASECPSGSLISQTETNAYGSFCYLEYTSVDSGEHWAPTNAPKVNGQTGNVTGSAVTNGYISFGTFRTQGQRLYGVDQCTVSFCSRLVRSDDGGRSWVFADQGLVAAGAGPVCDYTTNPANQTVYAVTGCLNGYSGQALWRSDNGGDSWAKLGRLGTVNESGLFLTQVRSTGATVLYMGAPNKASGFSATNPAFTASPSDVKYSLDGGRSWQSAPTAGIPADYDVNFTSAGLLGTLSDGSIVIVAYPHTALLGYQSGGTFYSWKPGDASWRTIASVTPKSSASPHIVGTSTPVSPYFPGKSGSTGSAANDVTEVDTLLIVPTSNGGDTLYTFLDHRGGPGTFTAVELRLGW